MFNTQQLEKNLAFFAQYLVPNKDFSINFSKKDFDTFRNEIVTIEENKETARLYDFHKGRYQNRNFPRGLKTRIVQLAADYASKKVPTIETLKNYKLVTIDFIEYFDIHKNGETIKAKRYWYKLNEENYKKWQEILEFINDIKE